METTLTPPAGAAGPALAAAFAAWQRLPTLADALAKPGSAHLVIDPDAGQILHASQNARPLADGLAGPGLADLCRRIAAIAPADAPPRLARLRLDARRLAPPMLCWLARFDQDRAAAILIVPTTPLTLPRGKSARADDPPNPSTPPDPGASDGAAKREDRFLWRIDATGTLTTLSGPQVLADLVGRTVQDLAAAGRIAGADGILAALAARRTFRGERATLDVGTGSFQVEMSGAPLGRGEAAYSGFAGFGLIRSAPPARSEAGSDATRPIAPETPPVPSGVQPSAATAPGPVSVPLSTDEHAAFREIARALGARYAGDEVGPDTAASRPEGGAIMPFPGPQSAPPDPHGPGTAGAESGLLAGLPLPALVHRAGAILAANGKLLELSGHDDLASLTAAGLAGLFPGLPQADAPESAARRTTLAAADGRARPVEALPGPCTWAGEPAECLIVRPLDEADTAGALTAERLARAAQAERTASAEAALDALETGVVTIDGTARIVAINRAAAGLLACDPREIVGGSFIALFDRDSVLAVADLLRGAVRGPRAVSLAGRTVALDVTAARADGLRVAVLDQPARRPGILHPIGNDPDGQAPTAPGAALGRLDRAFREPLTGMIELADAMLKEPFGPLGDSRYRGCLGEIRASGETMLERVGTLLDLAAVEAGSLRLEPRPLDLNDVAAGCIAQLQAEAARGRIVVRTSFSTDLADLEADERSVSRAASLVIEHAIRRSTAGGQVIVSTGATEQAAIALRVRDTGAGAGPRAANPAGDGEDGLALPRALVEANGGRLRLSAPAEDGTLVEIIMPTRRAVNG
ncbi:PAS domain-containing sensor histidine kinase [Methylobacterium sp. J-070]|uniref:sensor histidine kinase n=1 Tax=Methylobacterium sp. J-070 TaxID=2836650 RepID=UPI001FBC0DE2|nr:PAS domain-containing sensor histidine kinase [Methylobacterium sp. J-070]MCJ2049529.1 PAS domain-containing sensor histidine kinase [Methylobacterium sp. J-070]